jgi:hypothetical protein
MAFRVDISMSAKAWKRWEFIVWGAMAVLIIATIYSNWVLPRGNFIDTGDVNCPDYGQCEEQYYEDTRNLNIPGWAKNLRNDGEILPFFGLLFLGWYLNSQRKDQESRERTAKTHHQHTD